MALLTGLAAGAATLPVGPGKQWLRPCEAIAAAAPGDTIEIDSAGIYAGDVCAWNKDRLTLRGMGGRARIDAAGRVAQGKAIWVIAGNDTVVENIEFTGAAAPDRNGAGIRQEGRNLTVRNCRFLGNEEGLLAGDSPGSEILIEYSEFGDNGAGDGQSHNLYINHVARFTMRFSYSHHSRVGHLVKSRAAENFILYNRLSDESGGTGSYEIDLPNGGRSLVMGNLVEQSAETGNSTVIAYREEGPHPGNPETALVVASNTFVNHRPGPATFVFLGGAVPTPAQIRNNLFSGPGAITNQAAAVLEGNMSAGDSAFAAPESYNFRLLPNAAAVDAGVEAAPDWTPAYQYVHPACGEARKIAGRSLDAGAFELGGSALDPGAPPRCRMIDSGGIVNGADFLPGPVSSGSLVAAFGANLTARPAADPALAVTVNGEAAVILAAGAAQLAVRLPHGLQPGEALLEVREDGAKIAGARFEIAALAPAIFLSALQPARPGSAFDVYFTGFGDSAPPAESVRVAAGGLEAEVRQVEALPGDLGVARASVIVPLLDPGEHPLELSLGGAAARAKLVVVSLSDGAAREALR